MVGILLAWAVYLSGYPDAPLPAIQYKPHSFFVENACHSECNVLGWYNDTGTVYIDDRYSELDEFGQSLLVHEFVHYLQDQHGEFSDSCEDYLKREREAYRVQAAFLLAHGSIKRASPSFMGCF